MVDLPWSVVEVEVGRLEDDFTDLSDLAGLADVDEDFLPSVFFFFSARPLKPEVVWPSTTPHYRHKCQVHKGGTESV